MLKDITLGQYYPGKSVLHRMDARVKILLTLALVVLVFFIETPIAYAVFTLFVMMLIKISSIKAKYIIKGIKPIIYVLMFTALLNLFMTNGETVYWSWGILKLTKEGVILAVKMIVRLVLLVITTSLLTYTTTPIVLTDGIEGVLSPFKIIGLPAHELAMMMTIAIRFVPTLIEETEKITKAQSARLSDIGEGNIFKKAKSLVPLLVPLFISAFRRADDLAVAMESRCYRGGKGRTKLHRLKMTKIDFFAFLCALLFGGVIVLLKMFGI